MKSKKPTLKYKRLIRWLMFLMAFVFYTMLLNFKVNAQQKDDKNLDTENVVSVQEYQPTITNAIKITDNPVFSDSAPSLPVLKYGILSKQIVSTFVPQPIAPATIKGEPLSKLYSSYAKLGAGNYSSFNGEYFYNSLRSKKSNYSIHAKHLSSAGKISDAAFPGISDNNITANGKLFLKDYTLSGDVFYNRSAVHFYGFDKNYKSNNPTITELYSRPDTTFNKKDIFQRFASFGANSLLQSEFKDSSRLHHQVQLNYYSLYDAYNAQEHNIKAATHLGKYHEKEYLHGTVFFDYYNNQNSLEENNTVIIGINPKASLKGEKWMLDVGVLPMIANTNKSTRYYFYPDVFASYRLADRFITAFAGAGGKLYRNSFRDLTQLNPFLQSAVQLNNTNTRINIFGGVKGSLSSATSYVLSADYSVNNDMPLFVNYESNFVQNKFIVIYDNIKQAKLSGELLHQKTEKLSISTKANYYIYKTEKEEKAWYRPALDAGVSARYNLQDKIIARLDVFYISEQYAKEKYYDKNDSTYKFRSKSLKGIADINLGVEYRYTKKLSAYINFNNIGSFRYYRWNNYPTQRFNFMAGLSYSF